MVCDCSGTTRAFWGSKKDDSGQIYCLFCNKTQPESESIHIVGKKEEAEEDSILNKTIPEGQNAALRVFRFGMLFERVGSILQVLNAVSSIVLVFIVLSLEISSSMKLLGIFVIPILWGLGFLQTSLIRGLASYFQMRSSEYLEKRVIS